MKTVRKITFTVTVPTEDKASVDSELERLSVGTAQVFRIMLESRFPFKTVEVSIEKGE